MNRNRLRLATFFCAAGIAAFGVAIERPAAQSASGTDYAWRFETVETLSTPGCVPYVFADAIKVDPTNRPVAAWRESGCNLPYNAWHTGFRWARRDATTLNWTTSDISDQTCTFLECPGLRANPPALALRSDGAPFYLFGLNAAGAVGVAIVNLDENPTAVDPAIGAFLSSGSVPSLAADFSPNAAIDAFPNWVQYSGTLSLNVTQIETFAPGPTAYASGPTGQHDIVSHANVGGVWGYYHSNGIPGSSAPIAPLARSEWTNGLSIAADAHNRIHLAVAGAVGDYNPFWSRLVYLWSDDNGATWGATDISHGLSGGTSDRVPSIALDSNGNPAIAYWRYPDQIRLARFDGVAWHDALVTTTGSAFGALRAPKLAFDGRDRPVVFFYHDGSNALMLATGEPGSPTGATLATSVIGAGSIESATHTISCPGTCTAVLPPKSFVTLTATPAPGSEFASWTGACTGAGPCVLQLEPGVTSVGATFRAAPPRNQITVTTTDQAGGSGVCSLGDAIRAANRDAAVNGCAAGSGPDTIVVPAGIYSLDAVSEFGAGLPLINSDVQIQGAGAGQSTIRRAENAPAFRILYVYPPGRLTLEGVTIRGGREEGAGLRMAAPVVINDSVFLENDASGYGAGGAIFNPNGEMLTISRTSFLDNKASSGGAINSADRLSIRDSTFLNNRARGDGGALNVAGTTVITNSRFGINTAGSSAGAIYNNGSLVITSSTFDANGLNSITSGAGGALFNERMLTLVDSTFANNQANAAYGGALGNSGVATIVGSTFTQNTSDRDGGALWSYGSQPSAVNVTNSTISGNHSGQRGGGLALLGYGSLTLSSTTITGNEASTAFGPGPAYGGGFYSSATATVSLRNSVLAANADDSGAYPDCWAGASVTSFGYNLFGNAQNCGVAFTSTDRTGAQGAPLDPKLGPLADNGGPTQTHRPLEGSPVIDTGNPAEPGSSDDACPAGDQRGRARPFGAACDIGAVEYVPKVAIRLEKTGAGAGSVVSTPAGLDCGSSCGGDFELGTHIVLTAHPDDVSAVESWSNCTDLGAGACAFTVSEATTVSVAFKRIDADVSVEVAAPDRVAAGVQFEYTVKVTNHGPAEARHLVVTDTFAPGLTYFFGTGGGTRSGDVVTVTLDSLAPGANATFKTTVAADAEGTIANTAAVTVGTDGAPDPNPANDSATVVVTVAAAADLLVEAVSTPTTGTVGDALDYSFMIRNRAGVDATNVVFTGSIPPELQFISASDGCTFAAGVVRCAIGSLALRTAVEVRVTVKPLVGGTFTQNVSVYSDQVDSNLADNGFSIPTVVTARQADLAVTLSATPDPVVAGQPLHYFFSVTNNGPSAATGVALTLTPPPGATMQTATVGCVPVGSIVRCDIGDLGIGVHVTADAIVVTSATSEAAIEGSVTATENETDPDAANSTKSVPTTVLPAVVTVKVDEVVTVADGVGLTPSAMITIAETVHVVDAPGLVPSAMISVAETVSVADGIDVQNTAPGTDVTITPVDTTSGTTPVVVSFGTVVTGGTTTVATATSGAPPPSGFTLGSPALYLDVSTTAVFSGSVTVCVDYSASSFPAGTTPHIFHMEGGAWIDRTISVDTAAHVICALTTSLSPFVIAAPSNRPPTADAGPDQFVEATSAAGAAVTLNGSASTDPDGDALTYTWTGPFGTRSGAVVAAVLPLGTTTITLTVSDGNGGVSSATTHVDVRDTTPPAIGGLSVNPSALWPPSHKMVDVTVSYRAVDAVDTAPSCALSVASSEPEDGTGDGDTAPDWIVVDAHRVQLRAERAGKGTGRVYTIGITCSDSTGNISTKNVTVTVPKNR